MCTVNISGAGVRLGGVRAHLSDGDFVGLQYRNRQARFRIVWVASTDTSRGSQVGLHCLQPEKNIWQTDLPEPAEDKYEAQVRTRKYVSCDKERRSHTRYPVPGQVFVSGTHGNSGFAAKLGDLSLGGCFVQTESPLETGRTLTLLLKVGNIEIKAAGVVRVHYEGMAMGVEFTHMSPVDLRSLNKLVVQLQAAEAPPSLLGSLTMASVKRKRVRSVNSNGRGVLAAFNSAEPVSASQDRKLVG